MFSAGDPYCGIDLNGCHDPETGEIAPWAWQIVADLASYTEITPSGMGLYILVKAELPDHTGVKVERLELYDHTRYFTMTGLHLARTPPITIEERQAETLALYESIKPKKPAPPLGAGRLLGPGVIRMKRSWIAPGMRATL